MLISVACKRLLSWAGPLLLALGVAACGSPSEPESRSQQIDSGDPGLIHVHELAVEPDSNVLYGATHTGLFRITEGKAERVGEHFHDLMGFTITDEGDFLASGHPDLRTPELQVDGKPPLLGLVESQDRGAAWEAVSLLGDVDFHALAVRGDSVYGADSTSGRFMVSENGGESWSTQGQPAVSDFAISPDDPDLMIATGGSGALRSRDGGHTWKPLKTPPLAVVGWQGEEVFGVWPDGTVVVSTNRGDTWQKRGRLPGPPEALLVGDGEILASASGTGIVRSSDGGQTWDIVYAIKDPAGNSQP